MYKRHGLKRRITVSALVAITIGVLVILVLLSMESTRAFFLQRASVTQEYDEGSTGRFGNQLRSLPMLVERFWGFGPVSYTHLDVYKRQSIHRMAAV